MHTNWFVLIEISMEIGVLNFWSVINCLCNGAWNSLWWFLPFWTDILLVFFHFGIKGLGCVLNIVNINQINFRGWRPLRLNFGLCPGLRRWGFWWCSMLKRILTLNKSIKNFLQNYYILNDFLKFSNSEKATKIWCY